MEIDTPKRKRSRHDDDSNPTPLSSPQHTTTKKTKTHHTNPNPNPNLGSKENVCSQQNLSKKASKRSKKNAVNDQVPEPEQEPTTNNHEQRQKPSLDLPTQVEPQRKRKKKQIKWRLRSSASESNNNNDTKNRKPPYHTRSQGSEGLRLNVRYRLCQLPGHRFRNFPKRKHLHINKEICFFCGEFGHSLAKCSVSTAGGGQFARCLLCFAHGHFTNKCPQVCHGINLKEVAADGPIDKTVDEVTNNEQG